jgi:hypothetical protein
MHLLITWLAADSVNDVEIVSWMVQMQLCHLPDLIER